jgi:hypothetical protein
MKEHTPPQKTLRERIEEYIEIKHLIYLILTSLMGIGGVFVAIYLNIGPMICNPSDYGGDKLPENCKTTDCASDLQSALLLFSQQMDMHYSIDPKDYEIIFNNNGIEKNYYRDGIHYRAYFHLIKTDGVFSMKFYKRGKSEPGRLSTNYGNYGSIVLPKCKCE